MGEQPNREHGWLALLQNARAPGRQLLVLKAQAPRPVVAFECTIKEHSAHSFDRLTCRDWASETIVIKQQAGDVAEIRQLWQQWTSNAGISDDNSVPVNQVSPKRFNLACVSNETVCMS